MPTDLTPLLSGVPMPLLVIGKDRLVRAANPAAHQLFQAEVIEGRHHGLLFRQPDLLTAVEAALLAAKASVVRMVTPGTGADRVHEVTVTPLPDAALLAFSDLTLAEEMDRMRRDFVANVSHELRTPLTAISGFIETLRGPAKNDATVRDRFLAIMSTEAERMNRLVRDLLHLSRVESEERVRPDTRVDLAALARAVVDTLQPQAQAQSVSIALSGAATPIILRGDSDQMVQVLTNLVENAVKYGSPPGSVVAVSLAPEPGPRGPLLRLTVADQGEGIDPRHLPRLTERFYRADNHRSREMGGTGLGLAIVKHIVQRHRGRMQIESEAGKGSVFSVLLPMT